MNPPTPATGREIYDHKLPVPGLNTNLNVFAVGFPGAGGAPSVYQIDATPDGELALGDHTLDLLFQTGNPSQVGVNGISNEALLAVVLDRLRCFQKGEFASRENALAITHLEESLNWLHNRTLSRARRGVLGEAVK